MSFSTLIPGGASSVVTMRKPLAFTFAITARKSGTENPMWFIVVPLVPPLGAIAFRKISALGSLMISRVLDPIVIAVPPRVLTQNFLCSSTLVTLR
jgi:hypothetical protein